MSKSKRSGGDPRVFFLLQQANASLFRAADALIREREGILTAHQVILFALDADDGLTMSDLATRVGMSRTRLTNLLDTLEEKNLVRRAQSEADGRVFNVMIEKSGRDLIGRSGSQVRDMNEKLLEPFDKAERETIGAFLTHVVRTSKSLA